jgi:transcriptional regulator with XRE-family HTH domain
MTQDKLAKSCDVSKATIINWEKGRRIPDTIKLRSLAVILKTTTSFLSGETDNPIARSQNELFRDLSHAIGGTIEKRGNAYVLTDGKGHASTNARTISDEAAELVRVHEFLDVKRRHKLLCLAFSLEDERKQEIIKSQGELAG